MNRIPILLLASAGAVMLFCRNGEAAPQKQLPNPIIEGIGQPKSVVAAGATGSLTEALALEVPQGRKGIQPKLNLLYNSNGGLSPAGLGWLLDVGHIEPDSTDGIPQSAPFDSVLVDIAGASARFVNIGGNEYRARDEAAYRDLRQVGSHWEVRDPDGNVFLFGSQVSNQVAGSYWALDAVQDPNGNVMTIQYKNDGSGALYPIQIAYTGNVQTGETGTNTIELQYDSRPDVRISQRDGFRQETALRVASVVASAQGQPALTYQFGYEESLTTHRSLLTSVTLVGTDGTTSIGARTYAYTASELGWNSTALANNTFPASLNDSSGKDLGTRINDVNGDTVADVMDNSGNVYIGLGDGTFAANPTFTASLQAVFAATGSGFANGDGSDTGTRVFDINGDGRPDIVFAPASGAALVFLNTGLGWEQDATFTAGLRTVAQTFSVGNQYTNPECFPPPPDAGPDASTGDAGSSAACSGSALYTLPFAFVHSNGDAPGVLLGDANGDGLVDILWSDDTTTDLFNIPSRSGGLLYDVPASIRAVYLNDGHGGWAENAALSAGLPTTAFVINSQLQGFDAYDVNGDGIVDLVQTASGSPEYVWLGNGLAWGDGPSRTPDPEYTASLQALNLISIQGHQSQGLVQVDFNGDGLTDLVQSTSPSSASAYRNTGTGWVLDNDVSQALQTVKFQVVDGSGTAMGQTFADIDGDGKSDIVQAASGASAIYLALGTRADLLSSATSAIGEQTTVSWGQSNQFSNTSGGVETLPFVLPVVTSLQRSDGLHTFTSTMAYQGGAYVSRQFRGFALSSLTDNAGTVFAFTYSQADHLYGQTLTSTTSDSSGVRQETVNSFLLTPLASAPQVTQIALTSVDTYQFDVAAQVHTRVRSSYDQFLQLTEVDKDGDVTNPNDDGRTVYQHAQNVAAGIVSPISDIESYDANGNLVGSSTILFDGLPKGQVSAGNPTSTTDEILPGGTLATRTVTYDVYGNPVTAADAAGETSKYAYDASHTFRVTATDPLGRSLSSVIDPRFGLEVRSVDLNGNVTTRALDVFGRVVKETEPGDESSENGTRSYAFSPLGNATTQSVTVLSTTAPGGTATFHQQYIFDGFGQIYGITRDGPNGRTTTESRAYDAYGYTVAFTRASFVGDPPGVTATIQRDALERPLSVVDFAGGVTNYAYVGLSVHKTDVRGNPSFVVQDAYGNDVEHHEFVGGQELVTQYAIDALGRATKAVDPKGGVDQNTFDSLGRVIQSSSPTTGTQTFSYDAVGRLLAARDARGLTTTYAYDAAGELTNKVLGTGEVYTAQFSLPSQLNSVGRVAKVTDPAGTQGITYDARGRIVRRDRTTGGLTYVTKYSYDSLSRITQVEYPDGYKVFYNYGTGPWVATITDSRGDMLVSSIQYDANGDVLDITYGNKVQSSYGYRGDGAITSILTTQASNQVLQSQSVTRDLAGNITAIVNSAAVGLSQQMTYDEINRLTSATSDPSVGYGTETYAYDAAGNFTRKGDLLYRSNAQTGLPACVIEQSLAASSASTPPGSSGDPCVIGWSYPSAQRSPGQGGHTGQVYRLAFDPAGNLTQENAFDFGYDADRRLVSVVSEGQTYETNIYGWSGERVERHTPSASTVFIDGIYESDGAQTRRNVPLAGRIVLSVTTGGEAPLAPASAFADVGLISAPDVMLFAAIRSWLVQSGVWSFAWDGVVPRGIGTLLLAVGAAILVRRRLKATTIASGQGAVFVVRGVLRSVVRDPKKWVVALLVVVAHVAQVSRPAFAQSHGGETVASARNYYYHFDAVGNVNIITDDSGNVAAHREYAPYGEELLSFGNGGPLLSDLSFNDHDLDRTPGAQSYSFGARNYNPLFGIFTSADDGVRQTASSVGLNLHAFNLDNPFRYIDPTGHDFWDDLAAVFVAVVAVVAVVVASIATFGIAAVLTGIAIGAAIGFGVGLAVGIGLLAAGVATLPQALGIVLAGTLLGAFTGGAIASLALGAAASATVPALLTTSTLEGAAGGAISGTISGIVRLAQGGKIDDFLAGFFDATAVGAAVGLVSGAATLAGSALSGTKISFTIAQSAVSTNSGAAAAGAGTGAASGAAGGASSLTVPAALQSVVKFITSVPFLTTVSGALLGFEADVNRLGLRLPFGLNNVLGGKTPEPTWQVSF